MLSRYRRPPEFPPVALPVDQLRFLAGVIDGLGSLRTITRGSGQGIVRLTVGNLREDLLAALSAGFGVGSRGGRPNAAGRGLTWTVEGRWACLHVLEKVASYLPLTSPLHRAFGELMSTVPSAPLTDCGIDGCREPVKARRLCGRHLRQAAVLSLLGDPKRGDRRFCPVCAVRHTPGGEHQPAHLCERCRTTLREADRGRRTPRP